jgi:hypothetical protein
MPDGIKLNIAQIIIIGNRYDWKALSFYGSLLIIFINQQTGCQSQLCGFSCIWIF